MTRPLLILLADIYPSGSLIGLRPRFPSPIVVCSVDEDRAPGDRPYRHRRPPECLIRLL